MALRPVPLAGFIGSGILGAPVAQHSPSAALRWFHCRMEPPAEKGQDTATPGPTMRANSRHSGRSLRRPSRLNPG